MSTDRNSKTCALPTPAEQAVGTFLPFDDQPTHCWRCGDSKTSHGQAGECMPYRRRLTTPSAEALAAEIGQISLRLGKDPAYRHRAAEDLLRIQMQLTSLEAEPKAQAQAAAATREQVERMKFDTRQAMIEYGIAVKKDDQEGIRASTTEAVRLIDELAALSTPSPEARETAEPVAAWIEELTKARDQLHKVSGSALLAGEKCKADDKGICYDLVCQANLSVQYVLHALQEGAAPVSPACARSHPHEEMSPECVLRTEIARLMNENARLKAQAEPSTSHEEKENAARYVWLRKHRHFAALVDLGFSESQVEHWTNEQNEKKLDAAIDAARASHEEKGQG